MLPRAEAAPPAGMAKAEDAAAAVAAMRRRRLLLGVAEGTGRCAVCLLHPSVLCGPLPAGFQQISVQFPIRALGSMLLSCNAAQGAPLTLRCSALPLALASQGQRRWRASYPWS